MCQSHPGPEITQEYLNSLAALANYTLPTPRGTPGNRPA